tara:strand:- start:21 stop:572 length:552 start_codon:yes stop_codon:yes gene_type:complete
MAEFENIQQLLEDFRDKVIAEAKNNASGKLRNSLKSYVKESKNSIEISFEMEYYGFFQDKGVKGYKSSNKGNGQDKSPYRFGTNNFLIGKEKGGMSGIFAKWARKKGFQWRNKETGRFMSYKSMGYIIARSIYNKGIKPSLFFTKPFEKYYNKLPDELMEMFAFDMEKLFNQITSENFKKLSK